MFSVLQLCFEICFFSGLININTKWGFYGFCELPQHGSKFSFVHVTICVYVCRNQIERTIQFCLYFVSFGTNKIIIHPGKTGDYKRRIPKCSKSVQSRILIIIIIKNRSCSISCQNFRLYTKSHRTNAV